MTTALTHEQFIAEVASLAIARLPEEDRERCRARLTYGAGQPGLRGVTYYGQWKDPSAPEPVPFVEICSFGQESPVQLAGTTIHEIGHVLAGFKAGHGKDWKAACERLGLRKIKAAGTFYMLASFDPALRESVARLITRLEAAQPMRQHYNRNGRPLTTPKPCPMGIGTRGGTSRGPGSGSRLRKWVCQCEPKPVIVRVASDDFKAHCDCCGEAFHQE